MDILELILKNIEILVILAIIVFQVLAGTAAQNKKRQRQQQQGTANQQPQPPRPPQTRPQEQRQHRPRQHKTAAKPQPVFVHHKEPIRANDDCEWERALADMEVKAAAKATAKAAAKSEALIAETGIYATKQYRENALTSKARTGIVWMEILQPPVSMR